MSLNVVSIFRATKRSRDWTSQEIAEFYRVEASLIRASIPVDTDRGTSDEGDPWFVFCHAHTGDVIVHFARIDGIYIVASPALDGCVRGHDFRSLIEAQIDSHPLVIPRPKGGVKLFIHPAALLIVLVTTCFFKLSQSSPASAAESNDSKHVLPTGSSHSGPGSKAVILDDRATATVLAAIAIGIRWADNYSNLNESFAAGISLQSDAPWHTDLFSVSTNTAELLGQETSGLFHSHALQSTPPIPELTQQLAELSRPFAGAQVHLESNSADGQSPAAPTIVSTFNVNVSTELQHYGYSEIITTPLIRTNNAYSSGTTYAAAEVTSLLGSSFQNHVVTPNPDNSTQQLVEHVAPSNPIVPTSPTPPVNEAIIAQRAIDNFIVACPNFQVIIENNEVIMYDPGLTLANFSRAYEKTFEFSDGSSVVLIGLPSHATAHAAFHLGIG